MSTPKVRITCQEITSPTQVKPGPNQKIVHLVRHGQGTHNLYSMTLHKEGNACACARGEDGCPFMNEQFIDAKLTECGKDQATVAGDTLSQTPIPPQCVFVSPLFRTLETCSIALSKCAHLKDIPVIADEGIRERNGVHHCDMRSPKEEVAHLFPIVDFKNIKPGKDELFSEVRETEEEVAERGNNFFLSLQHREESTFAVFSHSSFLYNTLSRAFDTPDSQVARRFLTGETRLVLLSYS